MGQNLNRTDQALNVPGLSGYKLVNDSQTKYLGYLVFILVDLVVLNLYEEFSHYVVIDSFLISLLAATLLQLLLKLAMAAEHRIAAYFSAKPGTGAKLMRWFSAWVILFGSKFVMLEAVDLIFGEHVELGGIIPFYAVAFTIIFAELLLTRIYYTLADRDLAADGV